MWDAERFQTKGLWHMSTQLTIGLVGFLTCPGPAHGRDQCPEGCSLCSQPKPHTVSGPEQQHGTGASEEPLEFLRLTPGPT